MAKLCCMGWEWGQKWNSFHTGIRKRLKVSFWRQRAGEVIARVYVTIAFTPQGCCYIKNYNYAP